MFTANAKDPLTQHQTLRQCAVGELRGIIRRGEYHRHTAGLASGRLQANLAIMAAEHALDFMRFCQRNPKPCPLVGVTDTGNPVLATLGHDLDVRTDVPAYNIYRHGVLDKTVTDITPYWDKSMVAFALGCSFTFERALTEAGIHQRHIAMDATVPMYRSSILTTPAGRFGGGMVVSMRPVRDDQIALAIETSGRYPLAHGTPVHVGDPAEIGIDNIQQPDWGDPVPIKNGETPMFWACGVTPQAALENAELPLCITHKPGSMLITDIDESAEVPVL